ncbi:MAG: hypothetical protein KDA86_26430 [Planctomycetaceae bacterium]|nr:hypothetical protein [Planctomycetaceae bacterium]
MGMPGPLELIVIAVMVLLPLVVLGLGAWLILRAIYRSGSRDDQSRD